VLKKRRGKKGWGKRASSSVRKKGESTTFILTAIGEEKGEKRGGIRLSKGSPEGESGQRKKEPHVQSKKKRRKTKFSVEGERMVDLRSIVHKGLINGWEIGQSDITREETNQKKRGNDVLRAT